MNHKALKQSISNFASPRIIGIFIYFITLIVLTALLSSRYYLFKDIIQNGLSTKDIYSSKTLQVIDREKTAKRQREVSEEIKPILRPAQDSINEYMKKNLGELVFSIKQIRDSKGSSSDKLTKIRGLLEVSDDNYFINNAIAYLYKSSDKNFSRILNESLASLNSILKKGVSEAELSDNESEIITKNINKSFSKTQQRAITLVIKKVLLPNLVIDNLATDITRKNAMNSVNPVVVTYRKGDKIVSTGDLVSKIQRDALKKLGYSITKVDLLGIVGIFILVGVCFYSIRYYILRFDPKFAAPSYLSLISLLAIAVVINGILLPYKIPVYIIPISAVAILLTVFTNSRTALITTLLIIVMTGVSLQHKVEAMSVFIISAIIAIFTASQINYYKRVDLVKVGFKVGLIQIILIFSIYFLQNNIEDVDFGIMTSEMILGFISGVMSGIIALGVLPLIENAFKIVTPYGLAELADHNQDLLKRLQFEAPGTYHHSLMVSNLAEAASEAVGANPVLARVGAFYHDIGKLKRPLFFVENQSYFGIENPHEKLGPRLSKMIVTAHPKDGIELAKEYKLPSIIHQFIIQHHGNGVAAYFYKQALEAEGAENITKEQFRYTNPRPSTKEAAILMMADAVESAVRSLKNPSQNEVEEMINKIIQERLMDGQFSESPLTQKDLKIIASTFNRILRGMQHHRIKYHQNVLEELGQKSPAALYLTQSLKKIENEFPNVTIDNRDNKND